MGSGRSRPLCSPRSRSSPIRRRLSRPQPRIEPRSTCIGRESGSLCRLVSFSLCFLLILHWLSVSVDRHTCGNGGCCPYRRVCRGVMLCVALKASGDCTCASRYRCGVKSLCVMGSALASEAARVENPIRFGEGYEVDLRPRRLRRVSHRLKLERIPFDILLLLLEHRDETVTRDQIVSRIWGQGVFLDTDNSIRGAIRKLRQVLKDDAEAPRFIRTITGQGYRFIAPVIYPTEASGGEASKPYPSAVTSSDRNFVSELDSWLQARRLRLINQDQDHQSERAAHSETSHGQGIRSARRSFVVTAVASLALACVLVLLAVWAWRRA